MRARSCEAGATILVAGTAVFASPDPARAVADAARRRRGRRAGMTSHTTTLRVRYAETDQMGVVYYANYFVWFEVARAELLRAHGWNYREMEEAGVLLPVIEATCEYRRPTRYDDEVEVQTEARVSSAIRMEFLYDVTVKGQPGIVATGRTAHAAVGTDGRPCRLPDRVREALS